MKQWEPEQVRRIWQRVQNRSEEMEESLPELLAGELADSRILLRIAGRFPFADRLRRMAREDRSHAISIQNMGMQRGQENVRIRDQLHPKLMLQQCYERKLQRLAAYQRLQQDPRMGRRFQKLAQEEQRHCHQLLAFLSNRRGGG